MLHALLGASVAWVVGVFLLDDGAEPKPPQTPASSDRVRSWFELVGSPILLRSGVRYRACVELPWYVPGALVTEEKVTAYARSLGFGDVRVWFDDPGWGRGCDVYVEAVWMKGYEDFERPSALVAAWDLR